VGAGASRHLRELSQLILRMAQQNPGWGYTRIQGALANLSHQVGRGTIANVLKRNGIDPAPQRSEVWKYGRRRASLHITFYSWSA
jgi:putative transposase